MIIKLCVFTMFSEFIFKELTKLRKLNHFYLTFGHISFSKNFLVYILKLTDVLNHMMIQKILQIKLLNSFYCPMTFHSIRTFDITNKVYNIKK